MRCEISSLRPRGHAPHPTARASPSLGEPTSCATRRKTVRRLLRARLAGRLVDASMFGRLYVIKSDRVGSAKSKAADANEAKRVGVRRTRIGGGRQHECRCAGIGVCSRAHPRLEVALPEPLLERRFTRAGAVRQEHAEKGERDDDGSPMNCRAASTRHSRWAVSLSGSACQERHPPQPTSFLTLRTRRAARRALGTAPSPLA